VGTRSPGVSTRVALLFRLERIHARPARRLGTVSIVDLAAFVRARIDACVTHSVMGAPRSRCSRASSSRAALSFPSSMAPPRVQSRSMGSSSCVLRSPSFPLSPPDEPDTSPFKPFGRAGSNRGGRPGWEEKEARDTSRGLVSLPRGDEVSARRMGRRADTSAFHRGGIHGRGIVEKGGMLPRKGVGTGIDHAASKTWKAAVRPNEGATGPTYCSWNQWLSPCCSIGIKRTRLARACNEPKPSLERVTQGEKGRDGAKHSFYLLCSGRPTSSPGRRDPPINHQ